MVDFINQKRLSSIGLTFDMDWAPDFAIEYVLALLNEYNVKATIFATHQTELLLKLSNPQIEIGIHPDFGKFLSPRLQPEHVINKLLSLYPEAIGVRNHDLYQSTSLLNYLVKQGIKYDCNLLLLHQSYIFPFCHWNGLIRIPFFWGDDIHFYSNYSYNLNFLPLNTHGIKIFSFHPLHVYLNSNSEESYQQIKKITPQLTKLSKNTADKYIWTGEGTKTFLIKTLKLIKTKKFVLLN